MFRRGRDVNVFYGSAGIHSTVTVMVMLKMITLVILGNEDTTGKGGDCLDVDNMHHSQNNRSPTRHIGSEGVPRGIFVGIWDDSMSLSFLSYLTNP